MRFHAPLRVYFKIPAFCTMSADRFIIIFLFSNTASTLLGWAKGFGFHVVFSNTLKLLGCLSILLYMRDAPLQISTCSPSFQWAEESSNSRQDVAHKMDTWSKQFCILLLPSNGPLAQVWGLTAHSYGVFSYTTPAYSSRPWFLCWPHYIALCESAMIFCLTTRRCPWPALPVHPLQR